MILYVATVVLGLLQISFGPELHLWGGYGYWLPAFMILASGEGNWRLWLVGLAALLITGFFFPFDYRFLGLISAISVVCYWILHHGIDRDNLIIAALVTTSCMGLFIASLLFIATHRVSLSYAGSFLITLPLVFIWYSWLAPRRHPL